jgi:hypothetical protein
MIALLLIRFSEKELHRLTVVMPDLATVPAGHRPEAETGPPLTSAG